VEAHGLNHFPDVLLRDVLADAHLEQATALVLDGDHGFALPPDDGRA
jgi:hypothetical protein